MVDEWPYVIRLYVSVKSWFLLKLAETDRDSLKAEKEWDRRCEWEIKRFPAFAS